MDKVSEAKYRMDLAAMDVGDSLSSDDRHYALEVFYRRVCEYDVARAERERWRLIMMIRVAALLAAAVVIIVAITTYTGG